MQFHSDTVACGVSVSGAHMRISITSTTWKIAYKSGSSSSLLPCLAMVDAIAYGDFLFAPRLAVVALHMIRPGQAMQFLHLYMKWHVALFNLDSLANVLIYPINRNETVFELTHFALSVYVLSCVVVCAFCVFLCVIYIDLRYCNWRQCTRSSLSLTRSKREILSFDVFVIMHGAVHMIRRMQRHIHTRSIVIQ